MSLSNDGLKALVQRYFFQFTTGCGKDECENVFCASSKTFSFREHSRDQLAAQAMQVACGQSVPLCSKYSLVSEHKPARDVPALQCQSGSDMEVAECSVGYRHESENFVRQFVFDGLSLSKLHYIIELCRQQSSSGQNFKLLVLVLSRVFGDPELLIRSFCSGGETSKENSMQLEDGSENGDLLRRSLSLDELAQSYRIIDSLGSHEVRNALLSAMDRCLAQLEVTMDSLLSSDKNESLPNVFIILLRCPFTRTVEGNSPSIFLRVALVIPKKAPGFQAKLCRALSYFDTPWLRHCVFQTQAAITDLIMLDGQMRHVPKNGEMKALLELNKHLYYACVLAGQGKQEVIVHTCASTSILDGMALEAVEELDVSSSDLLRMASSFANDNMSSSSPQLRDVLAEELGISISRIPHDMPIPCSDFVHKNLNDLIELEREFVDFVTPSSECDFSFLEYPFILDVQAKSLAIFYDNAIRQRQEGQQSMFRSIVGSFMMAGPSPFGRGSHPASPHLRLLIRRDRIVPDTLFQLEMAVMEDPANLRKRLFVMFDDEPGIDEGGVQKEFFQLIVNQLMSPDFGMFVQNADTGLYWFNPTSQDFNEYLLIGMIFGLAVYNGCILNVPLPSVLFRKLLGSAGTLADLKQSHPVIANSLQQLLEYNGDVEQDFMLTFQESYTDVFGTLQTINLKRDGDSVAVTRDNRAEFVLLYADAILNRLISAQFNAFKLGWQLATSKSILSSLASPEELELLICGQPNPDLEGLRDVTKYDGYDAESATIRQFWEVFSTLSIEQRRRFLTFCTGSDRLPVGGCVSLRFTIARASADSEHLPSAHTCFNILLLPDYGDNSNKLKNKLLIAIEHCHGFGLM